ncbi:SNARE domain [Carpediemonas membranifera]|uniref:SNARE domain n=1 Tax=Carpediemonas membranifera TaxID=201153 RepID=A0A8J6B3Y0_9EUKA|nr:SNARE domain [Carpediemonas membranifera]|eukprot:KAG9395193.1 SNARE domain [Carpediemonas membranifera]
MQSRQSLKRKFEDQNEDELQQLANGVMSLRHMVDSIGDTLADQKDVLGDLHSGMSDANAALAITMGKLKQALKSKRMPMCWFVLLACVFFVIVWFTLR